MNNPRKVIFLLLISVGIALSGFLYFRQIKPLISGSLAPAFEVLGKSTQSISRMMTKTVPISDLDEKEYGDAIAHRYRSRTDTSSQQYLYLNGIMRSLLVYAKKPFNYEVFVLPYNFPNAYALPGGVIMVTEGLMEMVQTEAELASILAHEIGHIELEHCLNAIKYELALKKLKAPTLGKIADFALNIFLRTSYSKSQEAQADDYGYKMILETKYNPLGLGDAFQRLQAYSDSLNQGSVEANSNIIRDYFQSHPPIPLRVYQYQENAKNWWWRNPEAERYNGRQNLKNRVCMADSAYMEEWVYQDQIDLN